MSGLPFRPEFLGSVLDMGRPEIGLYQLLPLDVLRLLTDHGGGGAAGPGVAHVLRLPQVAPGHSLLRRGEAVAGELLVASLRRLGRAFPEDTMFQSRLA